MALKEEEVYAILKKQIQSGGGTPGPAGKQNTHCRGNSRPGSMTCTRLGNTWSGRMELLRNAFKIRILARRNIRRHGKTHKAGDHMGIRDRP